MKKRSLSHEAEVLDRYIDALLHDPNATPPPDHDPELRMIVRAIVAIERQGTGHDPALRARVWARTLAAAQADAAPRARRPETRNWRGWRVPLIRVASAAALILLVLGATLWLSPGARARAGQIACLVPGVGIRDCNAANLVAAEPVSITRDGATLTVLALLSAEGQTIVRLEVTGLPAPKDTDPSPAGQLTLSLRDSTGKNYPGVRGSAVGSIIPNGNPAAFGVSAERDFAALDPDVRTVEVTLNGPPTVGNWQLRVPVVPVQEAALPAAQGGDAGAMLHDITVRVTSVAADRRGLGVQLLAQTARADWRVRGTLGGDLYNRRLALHDEQGRVWTELQSARDRQQPDDSGVVTDQALFPPLPGGIAKATLTVPFVKVEQTSPAATLRVPLAGRQIGEQFPATGDIELGGFHIRVTNITLAEDNKGNRRLWLDLDGGDWAEEQKLIEPSHRISTDADGSAWCGASYRGDVAQIFRLCVSLPRGYVDAVTINFQNPIVAVRGPWEVEVPIPQKP